MFACTILVRATTEHLYERYFRVKHTETPTHRHNLILYLYIWVRSTEPVHSHNVYKRFEATDVTICHSRRSKTLRLTTLAQLIFTLYTRQRIERFSHTQFVCCEGICRAVRWYCARLRTHETAYGNYLFCILFVYSVSTKVNLQLQWDAYCICE